MAERIGSVYDIPDWLANTFPALTGTARAARHAVQLPIDAGADLLRKGTHSAFGLEEPEPGKYSGARVDALLKALRDTVDPMAKAAAEATQIGAKGADALRSKLVAEGASPATTVQTRAPQGQTGAFSPTVDDLPMGGEAPSAFSPPQQARPRTARTPAGNAPQAPPTAGAFSAPIDTSRPMLDNQDGSFSTERTITVEMDGKHFLLPTIVNGKQVSEDDAVNLFKAGTNKPVGVYGSAAEADAAAKARSNKIGQVRGGAFQEQSAKSASAAEAAPAMDLAAEFRRRVDAAKKEAKGDLTPQQLEQMKLDFFLGLMARGAKRGSNFIGAFGETGRETLAKASGQQEKNLERSRQDQQRTMEEIFREIGLMDKGEDNKRRDKHLAITEAHYQAMGDRDRQRFDLERRKLANEGKEIRQTVVGADGFYVHILKDGTEVKSKIRKPAGDGDADDRKAARMRAAGFSEKEIIERLYPGRSGRDGGMTEKDIVEETLKLLKPDGLGGPTPSPEDAYATTRRIVDLARGGTPAPAAAANTPGTVSRQDPRYAAALQDPRVGGDRKKLDEMLRKSGLVVAD